MNSLAHAALNKRTAARRSALLSAACAGALLIAAPAMAQQLETGASGTAITNITTDGNGQLTIGGTTATAAGGILRLNDATGATQVTINGSTGNIGSNGSISIDSALFAGGNITTNTGSITTNSGNVSTVSGNISTTSGNISGATLTSTGLATLDSASVTNGLTVGGTSTLGALDAGATTTSGLDNTGELSTQTAVIGGGGTAGQLAINNGSGSPGGNTFTVDGATGNVVAIGTVQTLGDIIGGEDIRAVGNISTTIGNISTTNGNISTTNGNVSGATLSTTGAATIGGTLDVTGATTLGQLTTSGQVLMTSTLTATGTVNAGNINILSGDIVNNAGNFTSNNGNFTTTTGTVSSATLSTTGAATIGSALSVGGVSTVGSTAGSIVVKRADGSDSVVIDGALGNISAFNRISAGALQSSNSATIGTSLSVGSMATIGTSLSVGTNATIGGTLSVGTNATIGGTLSVGTNATIGGTLDVTGETNTAGMTNRGLFNTFQGRAGVYANDFETPFAGIYAGNSDLRLTDTSATLGFGSNGMVATADSLTLRGGTASTTMTLNDSGASFANVSDGAPVTVTGIANGSSSFDAVNYGQLSSLESKMSAGIASIAAIANIPAPPTGKRFAIGGAVGGFNGETAFAIGGTANVTTEVVVKASVGFSDGQAAFGAGAAYAW